MGYMILITVYMYLPVYAMYIPCIFNECKYTVYIYNIDWDLMECLLGLNQPCD